MDGPDSAFYRKATFTVIMVHCYSHVNWYLLTTSTTTVTNKANADIIPAIVNVVNTPILISSIYEDQYIHTNIQLFNTCRYYGEMYY